MTGRSHLCFLDSVPSVLLLGSTGYVGQAFQSYFARRSIGCRTLSVRGLGLEGWRRTLREAGVGPGVFVLNCAGYTGKPNVDACELHKAECVEGNAVLPGYLRFACDELGAPWGHVSSGCIFTGERPGGGGFREDDAPNFSFRQNNCSFYSGTKALGEEALGYREAPRADGTRAWVHESTPTGYVWRLRIPFDHRNNPRNYLTKVITYKRLLEARNSLSELAEFVEACWLTFERGAPKGIYNVTNPGSVTTREVVDLIQASGIEPGRTFDFFGDEAEFMALAAKTPRSNTVMDTTKLAATGIRLRPVQEALAASLRAWVRS